MIDSYRIKRPNFIIFTDKDGTLNLEDPKLDVVFKLIISMNGLIIPITGRTIGDIIDSLKSNNLIIPEILVGDNGANIYSSSQQEFLLKKTLNREKVNQIIAKFQKDFGNVNMIRLTDGEFIYAVNHPDIQNYYRNNNSVKFFDTIETAMDNMPEITKITLAGSKAQMQDISNYVKDLDFWSDMGSTKFPSSDYEYYRLDVADKNINKGNAVKLLSSILQPPSGYICIGNGENDISMFKQAIDDGMLIGIMEDSPQSVINEMKNYVKLKKRGKMIIIPSDKNKANKYIYRFAKLYQQKIKTSQLFSNKTNENQFIQSIKFNPPPLKHQNYSLSPRNTPPYTK